MESVAWSEWSGYLIHAIVVCATIGHAWARPRLAPANKAAWALGLLVLPASVVAYWLLEGLKARRRHGGPFLLRTAVGSLHDPPRRRRRERDAL